MIISCSANLILFHSEGTTLIRITRDYYTQLMINNTNNNNSGGDGYGLWLDADFEQGSSATSDTYLNEQLSLTELFKVLRVEVWAPPSFVQKKPPRPLY